MLFMFIYISTLIVKCLKLENTIVIIKIIKKNLNNESTCSGDKVYLGTSPNSKKHINR